MISTKLIKYLFITVSLITLSAVPVSAKQDFIDEGLLVNGGYGRLIEPNTPNSRWIFEFTSEFTAEKINIKPTRKFPLLESSNLQQLIEFQKNHNDKIEYRIWAMTTAFEKKNFLYPVYFLPVKGVESKLQPRTASEDVNEPNQPVAPKEPNSTQKPETPSHTQINEPEDAVTLPDEILKRLKQKRTYQTEPVKPAQPEKNTNHPKQQPNDKQKNKPLPAGQFRVVTEKTGYIEKTKTGEYLFRIEGFGRKISTESYQLLPCITLEEALKDEKKALNKPRFTIAGITGEFKGKEYLLMHRAQFKYSYNNFGR